MVCYCIPSNQFWIVPSKDAVGKFKISMNIGNKYNNKWSLLSRSGRLIDGERFESIDKLRTKIWEHQSSVENLRDIIDESKYKIEILEHKIYNYYKYLGQNLTHYAILNVERFGTIHDENEWFVKHFRDDAQKIKYRYEDLCDLHEKLNKCRSGAQRDSATGCHPSVCSPLVSPA
jgi:hypothetical protein